MPNRLARIFYLKIFRPAPYQGGVCCSRPSMVFENFVRGGYSRTGGAWVVSRGLVSGPGNTCGQGAGGGGQGAEPPSKDRKGAGLAQP